MPDTEYFIPIYKTCPVCKGTGGHPIHEDSIWSHRCDRCDCTGKVKVLIPLDEFADMTEMTQETILDLKFHLEKT